MSRGYEYWDRYRWRPQGHPRQWMKPYGPMQVYPPRPRAQKKKSPRIRIRGRK